MIIWLKLSLRKCGVQKRALEWDVEVSRGVVRRRRLHYGEPTVLIDSDAFSSSREVVSASAQPPITSYLTPRVFTNE